ncbi:hypothetical protein F5Y19DRAFT_369487 [Xylariaceae sp. FL1651]|nr:hypothetical protein F5Y19DRAFT_369487 [Xylariaceae sp. FL1651]
MSMPKALTAMLELEITDIGATPYSVLRPILLKVDSAAQLRRLEVNSPHLEGDTTECWKRLIARDFPVLSEKYRYAPSNPKSWHKIYAKYQHTDAKAKRIAEEKLKDAFKSIKKEKEDNLSQVINYDSRKLPRLPRDVKPQVGIRARGSGRGGPDNNELRFTGGSRTKTNTPKSLLKRAMREAKEISTRNRLNTTTGASQVRPGQIIRAPQGMIQEKVNKARPLTGIRPPAPTAARSRELEDREARLRKAKEPKLRKDGDYIADEDLDGLDIEDEDGPVGLDVEDLEDLFDQSEASSKANLVGSSSAKVGGVFARKIGGSSVAVAPTPRLQAESQARPKPTQLQRAPAKSSSISPALGPTSTPPKPAPSTVSASPGSGSGPMIPRKRKAVDVFMKPKPKNPRP